MCARPNMPGVYTKVYTFMKWMKSIIKKKDYCSMRNKRIDFKIQPLFLNSCIGAPINFPPNVYKLKRVVLTFEKAGSVAELN